MTLTEFISARLDEDEADAQAIRGARHFHGVESDAEAEVLRLSDPARVLAEVEAKRRIVAWFDEREMIYMPTAAHADPTDPALYIPGRRVHESDAPVLRMLALPYADHPDYDERWRP